MSKFFQSFILGEPRSVDEVRASLDRYQVDEVDYFAVLREHHSDIRESVSILLNSSSEDAERHVHLFRLYRLLEMHGKAEQETLYRHLAESADSDVRVEALAGQSEHDIAFELEEQLHQLGYEVRWTEEIAAKAKVAATLVMNHLSEEEDVMFPLAEKGLAPEIVRTMTADYLNKCRHYLDESRMMKSDAFSIGRFLDNPTFYL